MRAAARQPSRCGAPTPVRGWLHLSGWQGAPPRAFRAVRSNKQMELPARLALLARGLPPYRSDMVFTYGLAPAAAKTPGRSSFAFR
jgi:hypothetical protein